MYGREPSGSSLAFTASERDLLSGAAPEVRYRRVFIEYFSVANNMSTMSEQALSCGNGRELLTGMSGNSQVDRGNSKENGNPVFFDIFA